MHINILLRFKFKLGTSIIVSIFVFLRYLTKKELLYIRINADRNKFVGFIVNHNSRHVTSHVTLPKKFKLNVNTIFSQIF